MDREGARKGKNFIAISMLPDVCNTPMGSMMVPVPYTVTATLDESIDVSRNVFFGGAPAFTLNKSTVPRVRGDEAGTGRGVKSGGHMGKLEPIEGNSKVLVNGNPVVRHGDRCKMNDGNTIGKIYCTDAMRPGCGIYNGKPTGDTNPPFSQRTAAGETTSAELNMLHQAKGVAIGATDAVVDMVEGTWDVAKGTGRLLNPETAASQLEEIRKTVSGIAHDPKSLWEAIIQPYAEAISNGEYGNALGRGLVDVGTLFIGGVGGAGKAGKAGEAASIAAKSGRAARVVSEAADTQVITKAARPVDDAVVISRRADIFVVDREGLPVGARKGLAKLGLPDETLSKEGWPDLPNSEAPNFNNVEPVILKPGTKIYRVIDDSSNPAGAYWAYNLPPNRAQWRSDYAVKTGWNTNGKYVEYIVPEGPGLKVWSGEAAAQQLHGSNFYLQGGGKQIWLPPNTVTPTGPNPTGW